MNAIISEQEIVPAFTRLMSPVADRVYKLGEEMSGYSGKEKNWRGPLIVVHLKGRMIAVHLLEETKRQILMHLKSGDTTALWISVYNVIEQDLSGLHHFKLTDKTFSSMWSVSVAVQ